jgi:hypothetical protein
MKLPIVFVLLVVLFGASVINRNRIYIRDPLATVYKTGPGVEAKPGAPSEARTELKQAGAEVYINFLNDVLVIEQDQAGVSSTLIQNWSRMPGTPSELRCLRWIACFTTEDRAPTLPIAWTGKGTYDPHVTMSSQEVSYVDGSGVTQRIELR